MLFTRSHTTDGRYACSSAPPSESSGVRGGATGRNDSLSAGSSPAASALASSMQSTYTFSFGATSSRPASSIPPYVSRGGTDRGACGCRSQPRKRSAHTTGSPAYITKGQPPVAASEFSLTGVGFTPRLGSATAPRRTQQAPAASASSSFRGSVLLTRPHLNNYLVAQTAIPLCSTGKRVQLTPSQRSSSAPSRKGITTGKGAVRLATSSFIEEAAAAENGFTQVHSGCATPLTAAAAASPVTPAASPPMRPLLRPHVPPRHREEYAAQGAQLATPATTSSAGKGHPTTFARRSTTQRTTVQRPPATCMTRASTLNRPTLLTRDASRGTNGVVANTPRPATDRATPELLPDPAIRCTSTSTASCAESNFHGASREHQANESAKVAAEDAVGPSVAPSRPVVSPSVPLTLSHRRSRRMSLLSLNSNSSASFLPPEKPLSADEEAAATLHFFQSMPNLSAAERKERDSTEGIDHRECSVADEEPTMGVTASAAAAREETPLSTPSPTEGSAYARKCDRVDNVRAITVSKASSGPPILTRDIRDTAAAGTTERLKERGNAYMIREDFMHAIVTYSEAIRISPDYLALWGNRASAFLLTFRYFLAVVDCLYVLHRQPCHVKASWCAAKAYAAAYRFSEAKKYYRLTMQACERGAALRRGSDVTSRPLSAASMDAGQGSWRTSGVALESSLSTSKTGAAANREEGEDRAAKVSLDLEALKAEEAALDLVEVYWRHLHHERWTEALEAMEKVLATASYTGPTAVPWKALRLEALLHMHPKKALTEAEVLHNTYPESLELYPVLTKAIFYSMHDVGATNRCLALLDEANEKRQVQNRLLNLHVRYCAARLRESPSADEGRSASVHMETWARSHQLLEDSRTTELRLTIKKFSHHRDAGNCAYEAGDWDAAASAYTRCLETDRLNHALLAAVYCNRTAVNMQAGRWQEALKDADTAVSLSPLHATAYGRRGRVQLHFLAEEYEAQRGVLAGGLTAGWALAAKERLRRYADLAVTDLTRAVELSPTEEHKAQLQQAVTQRQALQAILRSVSQPPRRMASSFTTSNGGGRHRSQSTCPPPPHVDESRATSAAARELEEHLRLLGLRLAPPTAAGELGKLPDPKVLAKAYREAALRWHPDKWVSATPREQQTAEQQFKSICVAYQSLREKNVVLR